MSEPQPHEKKSLSLVLVRSVLPIGILAVGLAVLIIAGKLRPAPKKESHLAGPPRVETVAVEPYTKGLTIDVDGSVVPFREIALASEVGGRVMRKASACRAGNFVKSGALLFEIDPIDYDLEVRRLSKEVRQAEINVHSIDVDLENTQTLIDLGNEDLRLQQKEVARLQKLARNGATSDSELDRAKRTEIAARNILAQLQNQARSLVTRRASELASLDLAKTRLEKAEIDLKRTKVIAPIDGVIVRELVEEDAFVQRGAVLVEIEDTSVAEIKCNLRVDQLFWLWEAEVSEGELVSSMDAGDYELPNTPATVIYRIAGREFAWQGRLARYEGSGLDPRTRTVPCRVVVDDPRSGVALSAGIMTSPPALVRGMFVEVEIHVDPKANLASIPLQALQPGNVIWRLEDGVLRIEKVRVARLTEQSALLETAGASFQLGDRLVTTPLSAAEDGMRINDATTARLIDASQAVPASTAGEMPAEEVRQPLTTASRNQ